MAAGDKRPIPQMGKSERSAKQRVNDHEQDLADRLGGRRQPNSGALDQHKGDVKLEHFLLDSKETIHNSIILDGKDLTKITREADGEGKVPGLIITIKGVPPTTESEWVLTPLSAFVKILEAGQDDAVERGWR